MSDTEPAYTRALQAAFATHPEHIPSVPKSDPNYLPQWRQLNIARMSLLNDSWPHKVEAFRRFYQRPVNAAVAPLSDDEIQTHHAIIQEEWDEFWTAVMGSDLIEQVDGALDLIYTLLGYLIHLGISPAQVNAAFEEIHASNLTKADTSGKPIISPAGKILKGPNYTPANLPAAMESQAPPFQNPFEENA